MMFMPIFSPTHAPAGVTMVAGQWDASGGGELYVYGYGDGEASPVVLGSIAGEPLEGQTLGTLVYVSFQQQSAITFHGDIVSLVASKTLYVDGVPYSLSEALYDNDLTQVAWYEDTGPIFANGVSYNIKIE